MSAGGIDLWVVDTNVVVAGLLTSEDAAPPAIILDALVTGRLRCLISVALLAEYRAVLLRPPIRARHGLAEDEIDALLEAIARTAVPADDAVAEIRAPDPGDEHLWRLLANHPEAGLITGDRRLIDEGPAGRCVLTPREWFERWRPGGGSG